jgi:hypothetical protein
VSAPARWRRLARAAALGAGLAALAGCAVHYHDPATGADHVWGFGHLVMKAAPPRDGQRAVVRRVALLGVSLGVQDRQPYLTVGWDDRQRLDIVDEDAALALEGPRGDLVNLRIGAPAEGPRP